MSKEFSFANIDSNINSDININTYSLSKEKILSHTSQERIMEFYTGITIRKKLFRSPLRQDNHPTCSYYMSRSGELILKDFGTGYSGNCFQVVMTLFNVNYGKALKIIANDFGIKEYLSIAKNTCLVKKFSEKQLLKTERADIEVGLKDFNKEELLWWNQFGISKHTLKKFKVFACESIVLNGNPYYVHSETNPAYAYYHKRKTEDHYYWKVYFPKKRVNRFLGNYDNKILQGAAMLPKSGTHCVITKSLKDVMTLYELGITSIAPNSESIVMIEKQYEAICKRYNNNIFLFFDNDLAGIATAKKYKAKYPNIKIIFLKRKLAKDISDLCKNKGLNRLLEAGDELNNIILGKKHDFKNSYFYLFK